MVYSLFFNPENPPPPPPPGSPSLSPSSFYANRKNEERFVRRKHRDRDIESQWLEKVENWVSAVFAVQYHESVRKLFSVSLPSTVPRSHKVIYILVRPALFCKRLSSPGVDSKESIPPAYVARRAGTTTLFVSYWPAQLHRLVAGGALIYKFGFR
jgi:hypothetical protein